MASQRHITALISFEIALTCHTYHTDIFRRLKYAVTRRRPKKWRTNSWFLLPDNAPARRSVSVKNFLAKSNMTTLEHLPCSPDLDAADFYLFRRLKSALEGRHFCDVSDINKNATDELKRL